MLTGINILLLIIICCISFSTIFLLKSRTNTFMLSFLCNLIIILFLGNIIGNQKFLKEIVITLILFSFAMLFLLFYMKEKFIVMEEIEAIYNLSYIKYPLYILIGTLMLCAVVYSSHAVLKYSESERLKTNVFIPVEKNYFDSKTEGDGTKLQIKKNKIYQLRANPFLERFSDMILIYIGVIISLFIFAKRDEEKAEALNER